MTTWMSANRTLRLGRDSRHSTTKGIDGVLRRSWTEETIYQVIDSLCPDLARLRTFASAMSQYRGGRGRERAKTYSRLPLRFCWRSSE